MVGHHLLVAKLGGTCKLSGLDCSALGTLESDTGPSFLDFIAKASGQAVVRRPHKQAVTKAKPACSKWRLQTHCYSREKGKERQGFALVEHRAEGMYEVTGRCGLLNACFQRDITSHKA